ncbi:MAG: FAD-dependent monooxygenase [Pseudonocardia sp.]|nr:FAD-dependent monooxygenase [Pseudonocardia sp.]
MDVSRSTGSAGGERALVVGLGIAGMSSALGLTRAGWEVQIIERAPDRRTGGYFIGLSKEGFEAARYLGVVDELRTHTPESYSTWEIDRSNTRRRGMSFTEQPNHPEVVRRGDIELALWSGIEKSGITVRFDTVPVTIGSNADEAVVRLTNRTTGETTDEVFDLVVGADGVRSTVRRLVFGPDSEFTEPLGRIICAFQLKEPPPETEPTDGLIIAEEKRALWIFPFSDQPPTALFTYLPDNVDAQFRMHRGDALRHAYAGMMGDGVVRWALDQFDQADNYLFDSVVKVTMPRWHHNRVVLVGDAAWCLTLYSGYGATAALHGGATLGKLLTEFDDIDLSLDEWERAVRPFIRGKGGPTALKSQLFVPSNRVAFVIRSVLLTYGVLPRLVRRIHWRQRVRAKILRRLFGERADAFPFMTPESGR